MMKKIFITVITIFSFCSVHAQLEKVIVEKYYITDVNDATDTNGGSMLPGTTTYRIFIDLLPNTQLKSIYGTNGHPVVFESTLPFYNHATDGQTYAKEFLKNRYSEGLVALDTWMTLGQTTKTQAGKTYFGIPKISDSDGSFIGGINNDGGSALIASGLLNNSDAQIGIPLTTADGMDTMVSVPGNWFSYGIIDQISALDTTIFGSIQSGVSFNSEQFLLQNSGVTGVDPIANQVLIAQLTTAGELSFELNIEVEALVNGALTTIKYVARDTLLSPNEAFSPFMSYPFECGCNDPNYLEYNPLFACLLDGSCITPIVLGCMDTNACNFDPYVNFNVPGMCCYPGSCGGRDIAVVCPELWVDNFEIKLVPNPTENTAELEANGNFAGQNIRWKLYNAFGVVISSSDAIATSNHLDIDLGLSEQDAGVYFLDFTAGDLTKSEILIKTK
jgi:hypothetical protein